MSSGAFQNAVFTQVSVLMLGSYGPLCSKIALRCWTELGMQRARDIGHRVLNLASQLRTLPFEFPSYVVRSLCNQLLEYMSRNFLPKAEVLGEDRIALRPFNHVQKAEIRQASAIVRRN